MITSFWFSDSVKEKEPLSSVEPPLVVLGAKMEAPSKGSCVVLSLTIPEILVCADKFRWTSKRVMKKQK